MELSKITKIYWLFSNSVFLSLFERRTSAISKKGYWSPSEVRLPFPYVCYLTMTNSFFARFARAIFILVRCTTVLVLCTTWNDLFCGYVDDENSWPQVFKFSVFVSKPFNWPKMEKLLQKREVTFSDDILAVVVALLLQFPNTWVRQPRLLLSLILFRAHNLDPDDSEVLFHLSLCQAHMRQVSKSGDWNRIKARMHLANEQKAAVASTVLCWRLERSPVVALTRG